MNPLTHGISFLSLVSIIMKEKRFKNSYGGGGQGQLNLQMPPRATHGRPVLQPTSTLRAVREKNSRWSDFFKVTRSMWKSWNWLRNITLHLSRVELSLVQEHGRPGAAEPTWGLWADHAKGWRCARHVHTEHFLFKIRLEGLVFRWETLNFKDSMWHLSKVSKLVSGRKDIFRLALLLPTAPHTLCIVPSGLTSWEPGDWQAHTHTYPLTPVLPQH